MASLISWKCVIPWSWRCVVSSDSCDPWWTWVEVIRLKRSSAREGRIYWAHSSFCSPIFQFRQFSPVSNSRFLYFFKFMLVVFCSCSKHSALQEEHYFPKRQCAPSDFWIFFPCSAAAPWSRNSLLEYKADHYLTASELFDLLNPLFSVSFISSRYLLFPVLCLKCVSDQIPGTNLWLT